ncbi:hypothetical protein D3C87_1678980 [compost metagenome]
MFPAGLDQLGFARWLLFGRAAAAGFCRGRSGLFCNWRSFFCFNRRGFTFRWLSRTWFFFDWHLGYRSRRCGRSFFHRSFHRSFLNRFRLDCYRFDFFFLYWGRCRFRRFSYNLFGSFRFRLLLRRRLLNNRAFCFQVDLANYFNTR